MAKLYQKISVTGVINTVVWGTGLTSSREEHKHLDALLLVASSHNDNEVLGYIERQRIVGLSDHLLPATVSSASDRLARIEVDQDIPVGQTFKAGVDSGSTATSIYGAYEYHLVG